MKNIKIITQPVAVPNEYQHAAQMFDAAFDCAAAVLNLGAAAATIEAPPFAASFAYNAITSGIACTTKVALISSSATDSQYKQASSALDLLSPMGLMIGIIGAGLQKDTSTVTSTANNVSDLLGSAENAASDAYILGSFSKGKWAIAALFTNYTLKTMVSVADVASASNAINNTDRIKEHGSYGDSGQKENFTPAGGPGQHPEPF